MAAYSVDDGKVGVHDKTLVAGTVDSVSFAEDPKWVRIVTDGAAKMYVTLDGSEPSVSGTHTHIVPAAACEVLLEHGYGSRPVKLISGGAPVYSVERA